MTTAIRRRRGTTAQHSTFIGLDGETTIDTDKEVVVVHDGTTQGGFPLMRENGSNSALALGSAATPSLKFTGDTNTGIYSPGADQVAISTNGSGRLFVDANGSIGVNTASPSALLTVHGGGAAMRYRTGTTVDGRFEFAYNTTDVGYIGIPDATTFSVFARTGNALQLGAGGAERLRITSAGLVGIGNSSPSKLLTIGNASTANTTVRLNCSQTAGSDTGMYSFGIDDSTDFAGMRFDFTDRTTKGLQIFTGPGYSYPISFSGSSGNQDVTIDASGRLGIGTQSPGFLVTAATSADGVDGVSVESPSVNGVIRLRADGTNGNAIRVGGVGAQGNTLRFLIGGDAERARIDSSGRLLVGTSSSITAPDAVGANRDGSLQLAGNLLATTMQGNHFFNVSGTGPLYQFTKSNTNTIGNHTIVALNDRLGTFQWSGSDGTNYIPAAQIYAQVDGTPGTNDMPGRLVFSTTADGASSPTERMRITQAGHVGIGKTSTKYKLDASEARIGTGCVVYSANTTKTASTTHTATITFESQGSAWEPKYVEIMFAGSSGTQSTAYAGMARYMFTTITSMGTVTELEDSGNGVSFAATTSGMDLIITATTTANNSYIGFSARITCGGSGNGFPTGMVIA